MKNRILILLMLLVCAVGTAQTFRHPGKVKIHNTPTGAVNDTLIAVDSEGLIVKSGLSISDLGLTLEGYNETGTRAGDDLVIDIGDNDAAPYLKYTRATNSLSWYNATATITGPTFGQFSNFYNTQETAGGTVNEPTGIGSITMAVASTAEAVTHQSQFSILVGRGTSMSNQSDYSAAFGSFHTLTNTKTFAAGSTNTISGQNGAAIGGGLNVPSFSEVVVGSFNDTYTATGVNAFNSSDRAFTVGIGSNSGLEANGFLVDKTGHVYAPELSDAEIDAATNDILITKGWADTEYATEFFGSYGMDGNASATTITVAGTFYKVAGSSTAITESNFTHTDNRLTYNGTDTQHFMISCEFSMIAGANNVIVAFKIAKNGTELGYPTTRLIGTGSDIGAASIMYDVQLATNDYIELFVTNETSTATVTVEDMYLCINKIR